MDTVFVSRLKPVLDAVSKQMELYVPKKSGDYFSFTRYNSSYDIEPEFNPIRVCSPVKEFLFPMRELAAVFPEPASEKKIEPFAVFGLKDCDLQSIKILDCVFDEHDYKDPTYVARREKMFIISSDCIDPVESCCCNLFGGKPYSTSGFDLNISMVNKGYVIEAGSEKGQEFVNKNKEFFSEVPSGAISERSSKRQAAEEQLEKNNAEYELDMPVRDVVEQSWDSPIFEDQAQDCVECQSCTRVCPTCHCFFLYDTKDKDQFGKMKMWDSCVRTDYARVAGDENPRKYLGQRARHRLFHKFVHFLDRYGIQMCVGCGRCMDGCAGQMEMREVLKKLNEELKIKK